MFEREMMVTGLQRQKSLLSDLIFKLEYKKPLNLSDGSQCQAETQKIASNLRKLRKIKNNYFVFADAITN